MLPGAAASCLLLVLLPATGDVRGLAAAPSWARRRLLPVPLFASSVSASLVLPVLLPEPVLPTLLASSSSLPPFLCCAVMSDALDPSEASALLPLPVALPWLSEWFLGPLGLLSALLLLLPDVDGRSSLWLSSCADEAWAAQRAVRSVALAWCKCGVALDVLSCGGGNGTGPLDPVKKSAVAES